MTHKIDYKTLPQPSVGDDVDLEKEFKQYEGIVVKAINRYKHIIRTKDEMEDLYQDAFLIFLEHREYVLKKYGDSITNFSSLFYTSLNWNLTRCIDKKYLLIRKTGNNTKKHDIYIEDGTPASINNISLKENTEEVMLLRGALDSAFDLLDDIEILVIKYAYGIDFPKCYTHQEIADKLGLEYKCISKIKNDAMIKLQETFKIKDRSTYLGQ